MEDDIPQEVKEARVEEIMELQSQISWEKNQEKIGKVFRCIFDRKEGNYFIGRTEYDSPDVDNTVLVSAEDTYISYRRVRRRKNYISRRIRFIW